MNFLEALYGSQFSEIAKINGHDFKFPACMRAFQNTMVQPILDTRLKWQNAGQNSWIGDAFYDLQCGKQIHR